MRLGGKSATLWVCKCNGSQTVSQFFFFSDLTGLSLNFFTDQAVPVRGQRKKHKDEYPQALMDEFGRYQDLLNKLKVEFGALFTDDMQLVEVNFEQMQMILFNLAVIFPELLVQKADFVEAGCRKMPRLHRILRQRKDGFLQTNAAIASRTHWWHRRRTRLRHPRTKQQNLRAKEA
jgi:hypothetical protein